ncbi:L-rhamnose mutarotase [Pedobacter sp. AW1-32]|uniref:L-rhamnose mutarotase n=1 Tax=Pedobacter sp. AW1-32 TaxID=3383026 RepID=UPI003FF09B1E
MRRFCFALDLIDDASRIAEYEQYHQAVWPEIIESIRGAGVEVCEIYRTANRLFMIMEVNDRFSFQAKADADEANPVVQKWETLMWNYQQALPTAKKGEKWILMDRIFAL